MTDSCDESDLLEATNSLRLSCTQLNRTKSRILMIMSFLSAK